MPAVVWRGLPGGPDGTGEAGGAGSARNLVHNTVSRRLRRSGGASLEGQMALVRLVDWENLINNTVFRCLPRSGGASLEDQIMDR